MKFDTVIIGGGLSGLICGIRLQQNNQRSIIISTGHSALHFSSGSFDLYSAATDGSDITTDVEQKISELIKEKPQHPYAKIGLPKTIALATEAKETLASAGITTYGRETGNHYRITPMGKLVPTWLTQEGYGVSEGASLTWKNAMVAGIDGYLDYFPHFVADELQAMGVSSKIEWIELPIFDTLRANPAGLIATSIARELDKDENKAMLLQILKEKSQDYDTLVLPACISMNCDSIVKQIAAETGKQVVLIPTLPPSVAGSSMQKKLTDYYKSLGGVYMLGDTVVKADFDGNIVQKIYSTNHSDIPFRADNFVLASGGFFSRGLIASNRDVREPLFNLDVEFNSNRFEWYSHEVFDSQEYQSFGVKSSTTLQGQIDATTIENLYVAGAILNGHNPIKEGSGGGVSILSALFVADEILKKIRQ